jgi:hypothetical protein
MKNVVPQKQRNVNYACRLTGTQNCAQSVARCTLLKRLEVAVGQMRIFYTVHATNAYTKHTETGQQRTRIVCKNIETRIVGRLQNDVRVVA